MFLQTLTVPGTVAGELFAQLGGTTAWQYIAIAAVAALLVAAAGTARVVIMTMQRYERGRAARIMQLRHPHCHVKRLSKGQWLLIDKDTGTEYVPPPLEHPPINEWI
ncbi:hypothetical protein G3O06_03280 [Burkholderia sp. Ac-20345]|uniref:hypothetical protein n=1 Tax=Burkholderia sp. Ac-20345 TaxID=2703891 RepID=UPI00197C4D42|nr:hypothetical protein [Burkholderia sp. Ac-20345]MBN3776587.1 hypothetical protein [Burkholderia sp. Ac-20345]